MGHIEAAKKLPAPPKRVPQVVALSANNDVHPIAVAMTLGNNGRGFYN
jgi:hypothetical protein